MDTSNNELVKNHKRSETQTAGYLIPETAYTKIKALNSHLRLLGELAQRPDKKEIILTASALENTLLLIESELENVLNEAKFLTHE